VWLAGLFLSRKVNLYSLCGLTLLLVLMLSSGRIHAQQKELSEVTILTAVSNLAFSAVWGR
jgi:hypothetical protein